MSARATAPRAGAGKVWLAPGSRRVELLLILGLGLAGLYIYPLHPSTNNPNENVRVYMTKALVDHGTYAIGYRHARKSGGYKDDGLVTQEWGYVNDRALRCDDPTMHPPDCVGTLYASKGPGTSWLGVPVYYAQKQLYSLMGWRLEKPAIVYWLRVFTMLLPTLLFYLFFFRYLRWKLGEPMAFFGTWTLAFATMMITYMHMFASHVHAAMFLFIGYALAERVIAFDEGPVDATPGIRREKLLVLAGLSLGWAQISEYPAIVGLAVVGVYLLLGLRRRSDLVWVVIGGALPAFLLFHFHLHCFGAIYLTPQDFVEPVAFQQGIAPGFFGITYPTWSRFVGFYLSPFTGLFFFTPVFLLWFPATAAALRDPALRRDLGAPIAMAAAYIIFFSSHSLWRGGWTAGPRYVVTALPFFLLTVLHVSARARLGRAWFWRAALVGLTFTAVWNRTLSHLTTQGYPFDFYNPIYEFSWPLFRDGYVFQNLASQKGGHGLWSVAPYLAFIALGSVAAGLAIIPRRAPASTRAGAKTRAPEVRWSRPAALMLAVAVALGMADFQATFSSPITETKADKLAWFRHTWLPKEQGNAAHELARVRAIRGRDRTREDWVAWTNALTLHDRPRKLPAYARSLFESGPPGSTPKDKGSKNNAPLSKGTTAWHPPLRFDVTDSERPDASEAFATPDVHDDPTLREIEEITEPTLPPPNAR